MQAVQILIRDLQRRVGLESWGSIPDSRPVGAEGVGLSDSLLYQRCRQSVQRSLEK